MSDFIQGYDFKHFQGSPFVRRVDHEKIVADKNTRIKELEVEKNKWRSLYAGDKS